MKFSKHHLTLILLISLVISSIYYFFESENLFKVLSVIFGIYLLILYIGVTRYRLNYFTPAIHKGNHKGISLTFDDGPNPQYTKEILDILKKHQAKATFFIIGKNIKDNEDILHRIVNEGHIIGNHSFSHVAFFNTLKPSKIIADIRLCNELLKKEINKQVQFFRTPFGLTSPNIAKALHNSGFVSIGWDFRTFDTMAKSETKLLKKMKKKAKSSSILLLHDNNKITSNILDQFLSFCTKNGIEIVSLDKMIGLKPYKE